MNADERFYSRGATRFNVADEAISIVCGSDGLHRRSYCRARFCLRGFVGRNLWRSLVRVFVPQLVVPGEFQNGRRRHNSSKSNERMTYMTSDDIYRQRY